MKTTLLIVFVMTVVFLNSIQAQTQFWSDNFEGSPTSGTRTPEENGGVGGPPNTSYFRLTDGSTVSQVVAFTGKEGTYFWAGEDHNAAGTGFTASGAQGAGVDDPLDELSITWTGINISGKTGLSFKGLLAANNTSSPWDTKNASCDGLSTTNTDYLIVQYRIDGGSWVDLIRFFCKGGTSNVATKSLFEDTNNDGCGDGTGLTNAFGEFTKTISGTGTTLELRINVYSEGSNEEWGADNFRLFETLAPTPTITTTGSLSAFTSCSGSPSTAQTFTVSGTNLTTSITVTAPAGFEVSIGGGYSSSLNLSPSSGTVSNTTILVRLASSASGTPSGNVDCSSTGATTINIAASGTVTAIPSVLSTTPAARCDAGTVNLGATASAGTLNWYAASSGGSSLGTGTSFVTPTLTTTTTYYVDVTDNSCTSARSSVVATVNNLPTVVANASSLTLCAGESVTLLGGGASTYVWTSGVTNGVGFVPSATTTYTVTGTDANTCSNIATVTIDVNSIPTVSSTTPASRCDAGTVNLGATASAGTLNWYAASSGGSSLGTGTSFVTPTLTTTTTYYVDATSNSCTSARSSVVATVNTTPTVSGTTPASRCGAGTVSLGATVSAGTLSWFAANSGGSSLGTGTSFVTPTLSVTTTYYVEASNNGCTSARTAVQATVNNLPIVVSNPGSVTVCKGESVTLAGGGASTYVWTSGVTNGVGFVPSATTTYTVTGTDANTCSNTATVTVVVNPAVSGALFGTSPICGNNNGSVSVTTSGGTAPFQYLWNNGKTTGIITGLTGVPTETLIVTVTDSKGCKYKDTILINCVLSMEENTSEIYSNISPNPSNGNFTVEIITSRVPSLQYTLEIFNAFGQVIYSGAIKENGGVTLKETIELNVPNGVYFIQVRSGEQSHTKKIIIER